MSKKMFILIAGVIFFSFGLKLATSAHLPAGQAGKYSAQEMNFSDFTERFNRIETKLDALSKNSDAGNSANKEIARKLELILSNQEKILNELAIVKVRASKR